MSESGSTTDPTKDQVLATQSALLSRWSDSESDEEVADIASNYIRLSQLLRKRMDSPVAASGLGQDIELNGALYSYAKGVAGWIKDEEPLTTSQALVTEASGGQYVEECESKGLTIPNYVLDDSWLNHGEIKSTFTGGSTTAELWSWRSNDEDTLCLALPRWRANNTARLFGVICQSKTTGAACYFDNPRILGGSRPPLFNGERNEQGEPVRSYNILEFASGDQLVGNDGGACSDCHAGQNAFVVHPQEDAFKDVERAWGGDAMDTYRWQTPLVPRGASGELWPQNPGPLSALQGSGKCGGCHGGGSDVGDFPVITSALTGYCEVVLDRSIGTTMPDGNAQGFTGDGQSAWLQSLCSAPPIYEGSDGKGTIIPSPGQRDEPGFISAPILDGPLYECARNIGVKGALFGATVDVYIRDGGAEKMVASVQVESPEYQDVGVPRLEDGQQVWVIQRAPGAAPSDPSNIVRVKSHRIDYPDGLPRPKISPRTTHECASNVAVEHVKGAKLLVLTRGGRDRVTYGSAGGYSVARADGPFGINTEISAVQSFCDTDKSEPSDSIFSDPAPSPLRRLRVVDELFEQQQRIRVLSIVEGATLNIRPSSSPKFQVFSWPTQWKFINAGSTLGSPNMSLVATQELCDESDPIEVFATKTCSEIPAPEVTPVRDGDDVIILASYIPGARIRVLDANGDEIGDSSGDIIRLRRPVSEGEELIIVQELGVECSGPWAMLVEVAAGL